MRFTTKTEYGLLCMIYLAKRQGNQVVTIKEISQHENYPLAYIEKIIQQLRSAGFVTSHHGNQGGYSLAKKPSEITLKSLIDVLEGGTFEVFCEPEVRQEIVCTHYCLCGVKPVWKKTKALLDKFYDSITLEMLVNNEEMASVKAGEKHDA